MRLAIMQPYLFPYIGYFQLMQAVDKFILYDDVDFINKGWVNRNQILVNGAPYLFTLPLKGASQNKKINELTLANDNKWEKKFFKTLQQSYKKAPYFERTYDLIARIFAIKRSNLSQFLSNSLLVIRDFLKLTTEVVPTSTKYQNQRLSGQERILDICQQEQAVHYINAIGGQELYGAEAFKEHMIKLSFLEPSATFYQQNKAETFIPFLSIIDVLMFNSISEIQEMLLNYTLKKRDE